MSQPSPYQILFEPVTIGPVTAPNRFYAVPHATGHGHLQPNGAIALRAMKAEGGWGVVAAQMTEISADSDMANHPMDRIWDDTDINIHQRQVELIKQHGALAAIELAHGGLRSRNLTTGLVVPSPSNLPILRPEVPVQGRAMSKRDIRDFREQHRRAALRAKQAGFDIVYVYAAHDLSLMSHFLSKRVNFRTDEYGGSLKNRVRLLQEVLQDTKEAVGDQCAVALRFAVEEPGKRIGLRHDGEGREVVEMLAQLPDLWDVNLASWPEDSRTSRFSEEGFQLEFTDFVKQVTDKPVVGVGRFTSVDKMVSVIKKGRLDFIGGARPSIADPFLPQKIKQNRVDDIRECIGCNMCVCSDAYGIPLRCTQNPTIAEEWRRDWHPERVARDSQQRNVLVVGCGPAGLECGLTLARAGHQVTLAEAASEAGGRVIKESSLLGLSAWKRVVDYRLFQLGQMANAAIYLESTLDENNIAEFEADHVFIATGSHWRADGFGGSHYTPLNIDHDVSLLTPDQILDGKEISGRVLIYDDEHNYMGGVLASHLARTGCEVEIVTPLTMISAWTDNTLEQEKIVQQLGSEGVGWHTNLMLSHAGGGQAHFNCAYTGDARVEFGFDHLLIVAGRLPNDALFHSLSAAGDNVTAIGDCLSPGIIQAAVYSGHRHAKLFCGDPLAGAEFHRDRAHITI